MVLGFGRSRKTKFETEVSQRQDRMERIYGKMLDSTIKLMERATELDEKLGDILPQAPGQEKTPDFVEAITGYIDGVDDIPDVARKPIKQWLKNRSTELNAVINGFIDKQATKMVSQMVSGEKKAEAKA